MRWLPRQRANGFLMIAGRLSHVSAQGFKCVRIDLYLHRGRVFVGEMTFWPMAGCYHADGQRVLGDALDFDRSNVKPPIYYAGLRAQQLRAE